MLTETLLKIISSVIGRCSPVSMQSMHPSLDAEKMRQNLPLAVTASQAAVSYDFSVSQAAFKSNNCRE
jgi:hypothetical protein